MMPVFFLDRNYVTVCVDVESLLSFSVGQLRDVIVTAIDREAKLLSELRDKAQCFIYAFSKRPCLAFCVFV